MESKEQAPINSRVRITISMGVVTIYIHNVPHIVFKRKDLVGYQSWLDLKRYTIEYTFKHGATIRSVYKDMDMWKEVLTELNKEKNNII